MLRNSQLGTYIYPVVPAEFTNWRREQKAWRETAVLFDQTHHMVNLFVSGPDALRLLSETGINSFANFPVNTAKQFVPDRLQRRRHRRRHPLPRRRGRVRLRRPRPRRELAAVPRRDRRLQRRGPLRRPLAVAPVRPGRAPRVLPLPDPGPERLAGHREAQRRPGRAGEVLPHGRADHRRRAACARSATAWPARPASSCGDPYEQHGRIRDAILEAGREFGIEPCGSRAYSSNTLESGWIPSPLPAIYSERGRARVPRVAARRQLRGDQRARRLVRLGRTSRTTTSTRGSSATARS